MLLYSVSHRAERVTRGKYHTSNHPSPEMLIKLYCFLIVLCVSLSACASPTPLPTPQVAAAAPTRIALPTVTTEPGPTATVDPYDKLAIEALAARSYGGGVINDLGILGTSSFAERHLLSYSSDGLTINGFMDIPIGTGPFPVVLVLHGYVDEVGYQVENYTAGYAASFANAGYIAIHPNYRNYPPSDSGPNEFRVGFAIDILNLIAIVKETAGQPGLLQAARPDAFSYGGTAWVVASPCVSSPSSPMFKAPFCTVR